MRTVQERLFSLIKVSTSTGESLFVILQEQLEQFSLSVDNIIGYSFDASENLTGSTGPHQNNVVQFCVHAVLCSLF